MKSSLEAFLKHPMRSNPKSIPNPMGPVTDPFVFEDLAQKAFKRHIRAAHHAVHVPRTGMVSLATSEDPLAGLEILENAIASGRLDIDAMQLSAVRYGLDINPNDGGRGYEKADFDPNNGGRCFTATPSAIDATLLALHASSLRRAIDLTRESSKRFGFDSGGKLLWLTDATTSRYPLYNFVNSASVHSVGFCATCNSSVSAPEVVPIDPDDVDTAFITPLQDDPKARMMSRRAAGSAAAVLNPRERLEGFYVSRLELGSTLLKHNDWMLLAQRGESYFYEGPDRFTQGPPESMKYPRLYIPAQGAGFPFLKRRRMTYEGNPYEPLLKVYDLGLVPLGWVSGMTVIYAPACPLLAELGLRMVE